MSTEELTGKLIVSVNLMIPDPNEWAAVNREFKDTPFEIASIDCTQERATLITERFRKKNPNVPIKAIWLGPLQL